ncbi:mitochondrial 2-oxodicarboxylate carrier NDAI_0E01400 [Naumovozyma dairenensis CBS 421]|uniref:Mitochondrial 2-oxodicarboxylate carrier 1 n=1 Tax=Naumovozyma dairenensis (strain ATCC 10597 / BCRC 20456 / CBS 421 / NBRC 0211 / NRRL Y-12639) TaxID=1071378 RepID=G0WB36_NAUDC|nr:hypothetical protein NDAI_0E01400 [Naumovozyma dairenensis CBS 421]CCD24956.1 hypothetical protein NDAI_0E01400 [Naumovozyma dairenensis CBS 421]
MSNQPEKPLAFRYQFMAGAIAGISELTVMYPLDVVKTRMQLQISPPIMAAAAAGTSSSSTIPLSSSSKAAASTISENYTGVIDCLSKIVKKEGFSRLYKGISSPMLMEAPKRATKFACNDEFQKLYKNLFGETKLTQKISILSGASAGIIESIVIVPFELVKIKLQDVNCKFNGPVDVLKDTVKKNGIKGLYNGLESTIWRNGVWNAGYFGIIFQVRELLPTAKNKNDKNKNDLIAGFIGGTVGVMVNTPFDVVKSRIQSDANDMVNGVRKYNWTWPSVVKIYNQEGFRALYKGFVPKVLRLGPGGAVLLVVFTNVMNFFRELQA